MKKNKIYQITFGIILVLAIAGPAYFAGLLTPSANKEAKIETGVVERGTVTRTFSASGVVDSENEVRLQELYRVLKLNQAAELKKMT